MLRVEASQALCKAIPILENKFKKNIFFSENFVYSVQPTLVCFLVRFPHLNICGENSQYMLIAIRLVSPLKSNCCSLLTRLQS